MKRFLLLAAMLALTLGLAAFAGSAAAGNGNGNGGGNGNGNGKGSDAASSAQPAAPGNSGSAPGQAKKSDDQAQPQESQQQASTAQPAPAPAPSSDHGQAHSSAPAHADHSSHPSSSSTSSSQPGVKPSSTTHHWTHTTVGANPDVSKRYGNGQTAAQIASSRGAPGSTVLTGPGNSQPHKVTACGKPSNRSGGVDVHAVKHYDATSCEEQQQGESQEQSQTETTQTTGPCPAGTTTRTETVTSANGVWHKTGHGFVLIHPSTSSAHYDASKHDDDVIAVTTVTKTIEVATGQTCSTTTTTTQQPSLLPAVLGQSTSGTAAASGATVAPQTAAAPASLQTPSQTGAGGVLGAQATLVSARPHTGGGHGVLGTAANVAGATLPFTGLPLWVAVAIAAALLFGGLLVRRQGRSATHP